MLVGIGHTVAIFRSLRNHGKLRRSYRGREKQAVAELAARGTVIVVVAPLALPDGLVLVTLRSFLQLGQCTLSLRAMLPGYFGILRVDDGVGVAHLTR